eukprot:2692396-Pyramimonas_sp.AAC.1
MPNAGYTSRATTMSTCISTTCATTTGSPSGLPARPGRPSRRATSRRMATECGARGYTREATRSVVGRRAHRSIGSNFIFIQVRLE